MPISVVKKNIIVLLIIIAGIAGLASCETGDPGCYQPTVVTGICGFQRPDTQLVVDTISVDPLITDFDTITVFGDSVMNSPEMKVINESVNLSSLGTRTASLGITFNQAKDSIRYTFRTDSTSTVYDTITIHYNSTLHFISNNCGYNYYFGVEKVTHTTNMLDSFAILQPDVTEESKRNIQFYFKKN